MLLAFILTHPLLKPVTVITHTLCYLTDEYVTRLLERDNLEGVFLPRRKLISLLSASLSLFLTVVG